MAEPLKNVYGQPFITELAETLQSVFKDFDTVNFSAQIFNEQWPALELKQRMRHISHTLRQTLPPDYPEALNILMAASEKQRASKTMGFADMFFPDFVEVYGLEHPEASLKALELFTRFSSSEFAIRPFIIKYPEQTMARMLEWSKHENYHVRRLSSEGCRPRLPWAMALTEFKKDPAPLFPILENLKADPAEYVRRSVANNLNDISKDHPELVLETALKWYGKNPDTDWIIRHASRSLLKKGNEKALSFFGFKGNNGVMVTSLAVSRPRIKIGDELAFSFAVSMTEPLKLRLEYGIYYVKANGSLSRKVFKISENNYLAAKEIIFNKKHSFRELTTRKHYPGEHKLSIIINGREMAETEFQIDP